MQDKRFAQNAYIPGECNIGIKEISVRRKFLYLFLPVSALFTALNFFWPQSVFIWLSLLVSSFCAIVLINEIRTKFCIIFGFFSLYNFKVLGNLNEVKNPENKKKDHQRVLKSFVGSLGIALAYSYTIHFVALQLVY